MDVALLASALTEFLVPLLPRLRRLGEGLGTEALDHLEGTFAERARSLWKRLVPGIEARESAWEAVHKVAEHPDDGEARDELRRQLQELLSADPGLASEIARLLPPAPASAVIRQKAGDGAIQIGQVSGNVNLRR
ncbi:MAG TPA: hypothetical protein VN493_25540 [Thermoanaerobaculia bacterium]|nr:hypothetical protein [Thermoanaerobaculia bacterium]